MRLEIVVSPHPSLALQGEGSRFSPSLARPDALEPSHPPRRRRERRPARDVIDVFIDGANVTARVRETHGAFVLRDLALALIDLARRPQGKATVRFYDEPWELCVERFGAIACLSVYRTGPDPLVAVYDRAVAFGDVVAAASAAIERLLASEESRPGVRLELTSAVAQLTAVRADDPEPSSGTRVLRQPPDRIPVIVEPDRDAPISFGAEFALRSRVAAETGGQASQGSSEGAGESIERSDMHALLFRGRMRAEIRGRTIDLGDCHPVLVAERLVELARRAFDAWERGLALHARGEASGLLVGVRVSPDGELALTLGACEGTARRTVHTFPALGVADVLEAALAFGRSLVRGILRRDRSQSANLRLTALRRSLRESGESLRQAYRSDSKVNPAPEPYRAFAAALEETRPSTTASSNLTATRLRYKTRWRAIVPGIDLRATYLCGDRVIVGAATEMWALDRSSGRVIWRTDTTRGTSVVTPGGIARLAPDGRFSVHDFGTGEPTLRTRIAPRVGGPVAGAVVHLPGLPRLVVVTEGEHHLVAIDLTNGEPRWRWSWGAGRGVGRGSSRGMPRMKRAGRLVYFTCGDGALTALDVMTGSVVWRLRDRLRFRTPPTIAHDATYVVSGGAHGVANLYCIDAFSGAVRWSRRIADASAPCTIEGAPLVAADTVAVAVRQKSGLALVAFRREDGTPIAPQDARAIRSVAPTGTSWLAVDDAFIGNAPTGEIVAVDANTGELRWRHVAGPRPLEADVPRRLEPVLRCGALFVPCSLLPPSGGGARKPTPVRPMRDPHDPGDSTSSGSEPVAGVSILRPSDGALLGTIAPTEAIPDLLRVDERCDVYVAEDSGHLVSFGALPRLSLIG